MIRIFTFLLALLATTGLAHAILPVTSPSARVKADVSLWNFRTQQELDALIRRHYNNPRASYYLINNAREKGFAPYAAWVYFQNAESKRAYKAQTWVSVAYAAQIGTGRWSFSKMNQPTFRKVTENKFAIDVRFVHAMEEKTFKSPEVLLMAAATRYDQVRGTTWNGILGGDPEWKNVFLWLRQAQKLAPNWADAHYWNGVASYAYWKDTGRTRASLLPRAKSALLTAQRLDPGLKGSTSWVLWLVADGMKRPKEQLAYMNTWFKLQPRYAKQPFFRDAHTQLVKEVAELRRTQG